MRLHRLLMPMAALLAAACQPRPDPGLAYRCAGGQVVQVVYEGSERALLTVDGRPRRLVLARSASGARYVGGGWQWWARGMHQARLSPLAPGETVASNPGVACEAN